MFFVFSKVFHSKMNRSISDIVSEIERYKLLNKNNYKGNSMIFIDRFFVTCFIFLCMNSIFFDYQYADKLGTVYMSMFFAFLLIVRVLFIIFYNYKALGDEKVVVFFELLMIFICFPRITNPVDGDYMNMILMIILMSVLFFHFFIWRGFIDKRYAIKNIRPSNVLYFIAGMDRDKDKDDLN